jgi:hypothetical protein
MNKAIVESISKQNIVVWQGDNKMITLTGKAVEKLAGDLKLGDFVEFDDAEHTQVIVLSKEKKASTSQRVVSSSPTPKEIPSTKTNW